MVPTSQRPNSKLGPQFNGGNKAQVPNKNKNKLPIAVANIQCEPSIVKKVFIWFLGQPVVWSEPNISQIEAWSYSSYAWYQEFDFDLILIFFLISGVLF
jgi:hypothetical protein